MNKALKLVLVGSVLVMFGCDKPNMKDEKAQYSYAIGFQIAKNMKEQGVEIDSKAFNAAMQDVMGNKEARLNDEERMTALRKMSENRRAIEVKQAEENLKVGQTFLETNKAKEGVKVTASGLQYKVVTEGKGAAPKATDTVEVHYRGKLIDGKEFDSSYSRNQPAQFPVKAVIPGWTEALQLMKEGAKYELTIPAALAYGERGQPPQIPPNAVLVFDVELLKVVKK
jgi:FKBP-type peptidyl-prolyl cis-trans isomerase